MKRFVPLPSNCVPKQNSATLFQNGFGIPKWCSFVSKRGRFQNVAQHI